MISQRELERRHSKLKIEDAEPNKYNTYVCQNPGCKAAIKTVDVHVGTTPMFLRCDNCGGNAASTNYRDTMPDSEPQFEWYVPSVQELLKWRKSEGMLDHIFSGGLLSRPYRKPKNGAQLILDERIRQVKEKDYDASLDDEYSYGELAKGAIVYATPENERDYIATSQGHMPLGWMWDKDSWKPSKDDSIDGRIKELVKAGALIAAEIDRLQRLKDKV